MAASKPELSTLYQSREPSAVRMAQMAFAKRGDKETLAVNCSIGNVSLPMNPLLVERMFNLSAATSPFKDGVVKYTATSGTEETRAAFLRVIESSGLSIENLQVLVTDGGSAAMELVILGVCGEAGSDEKPLFVINPSYSNYRSFADRTGRGVVAVTRELQEDGEFTLPNITEIEAVIAAEKPGAIVVIPYDNPTGQFFDRQTMIEFARLCVKHDLWLISDEAYRELGYEAGQPVTSIWAITEKEVPGITGRRISIESASKVWNGCGLRIGAIVTDSPEFHERATAEFTANLCAPAIDQYIMGALASASDEELQAWYAKQREYYAPMMKGLTEELKKALPGVIVSTPSASLYSVIDVRNLVDETFDVEAFVMWCATQGKVSVEGKDITLLVSPMAGFYELKPGEKNPGRTQMRVAYVEDPERMALVPDLFAQLFAQYLSRQS